jgi:serine phosphatase RsbU (regulator of sigma subunit)
MIENILSEKQFHGPAGSAIIPVHPAVNETFHRTTAPRSWRRLLRALTHFAPEVFWTLLPLSGGAFEKERARYWRALPLWRLVRVALGLFCTLGGLGFFLDLVNWMALREWAVFAFAALIGLNVVIFFVIANRRQFKLVPALVVLAVASVYAGRWLPRGPRISVTGEVRHRIAFDAIGMLAAMLLGYRFFLRFMNTEGLEQIRDRTELDLAHGIQRTLVPPVSHRTDAFEVYGITLPSEEVGGDLVDLIPTSSGWLACLADVSGHGIPAGVLMANVKTALRLGCAQGQPISSLLEAANRVLPAVKEPEMYATFACLLLSDTGEVEYSLAGHPPILHYRAATGEIGRCSMSQFPLGLMPASGYRSARVLSEPGDLFVLVSDGIVEAADSAGVEFGLEGLESAVRQRAEMPLLEISNALFELLKSYGSRADDQSILLVRARPGH